MIESAADRHGRAGKNWQVVRQDSNGVRIVETGPLSEAAARRYVERRERETGGHKQAVWAERIAPASRTGGPGPA